MATLEKVADQLTDERALVLLLDGLDHLSPSVAVQSLSWLPDLWPKHVYVVLTTDTADEPSMHNLSNHISRIVATQFPVVKGVRKKSNPIKPRMINAGSFQRDTRVVGNQNYDKLSVNQCFLEIVVLDHLEQLDLFEYLLVRSQRQLRSSQREVVTLTTVLLLLLLLLLLLRRLLGDESTVEGDRISPLKSL